MGDGEGLSDSPGPWHLQAPARVRAHLDAAGLFDTLADFDPRFIGSLALGLGTPASDADVVCQVFDFARFALRLRDDFGADVSIGVWRDQPSVKATLRLGDLPVDCYGRAHPVEQHPAWQWYEAERRLLAVGGAALRDAVRQQRATGLKTEAAFAAALGLAGDPQDIMAQLWAAPEPHLRALVAAAAFER